MTALLVDSSVLMAWYQAAGEPDVDAARRIRDAHQAGVVTARILELAVYEVGNVLLRRLQWSARDVVAQLDDLVVLCGSPLVALPEWWRSAAAIGAQHRLTFYDAAWAAAARTLGVPLVTADRALLHAGLGESPASVVERLRLP